MRIREERAADHAAVAALHATAFGDEGAVVAGLVDALRGRLRGREGVSLVAVEDEGVVGHVLLTHAWLDAPRRLVDVQVLSPLAVAPARQRQGIGLALIRRSLEIMGERGVPAVFLEGSPTYYPRAGFVVAGELGFRAPSLRIPHAAFQVFTLPDWESWMTGTLVYPDVFWEHDCVGLRGPDA